MIHTKKIIIVSFLLAALTNCFGMEFPKEQPLIKGIECAALFTTLAKEAQEVLLNEENDFEINDAEDETIMATDANPISKRRRYFECPICKKNVSKLTTHMRTHTGEKPFKCNQCDSSFATSSNLKSHIYVHISKKPYPCPQCDFSYSRIGDLKRHISTHTGEKTFTCDKCDYSCIASNDLKKHMRKHSGEKPYKCDQCGFSSAYSSNLASHKRKHTQMEEPDDTE